MIGVAFIVIVLIIVPDKHQSLSYVFTETVNNSGYGGGTTSLSSPTFWFVWGLGLLLAQYTITGFDASAHTAEETQHASRMAATGMWTSVVASVIFGWILLLAVTFAIPSTQFALDNIGTVVPSIWAESMSQSWAEALLFICVVAQFFCLTASVTSASRMMFAFSRDRAVPGHSLWRRVARNRIPRWSVAGIGVFSAALMIPAVWNYLVGYFAGTAIAVIGLYIAFILPVYLRYRQGEKWQEARAWSLGRHYKWIDLVSLIWVGIITILFIFPLYRAGLPWAEDFTWELTNYTILWFVAIGLIFGGWWLISARHWFKGPIRMGTEEELDRIEEQYERPATGAAPAGK
jgi:amino acid transporter